MQQTDNIALVVNEKDARFDMGMDPLLGISIPRPSKPPNVQTQVP
jgi:hypothetical protein